MNDKLFGVDVSKPVKSFTDEQVSFESKDTKRPHKARVKVVEEPVGELSGTENKGLTSFPSQVVSDTKPDRSIDIEIDRDDSRDIDSKYI